MLPRRRRPTLSPLASPRCQARSDGQDQPPLATTSPLRAHLALPRAHARILHMPSLPYSPELPRMTPPSLSPCAPAPQSHALCRPTSPNLRALPRPRPVCSASRRPPAAPLSPPLPPSPSAGEAPLSPGTYHQPRTSLLFPLSHPPTSYLCPLRWPTHRLRPPPHPPAHPGRLATLFTRAHASCDGLRVCAEATVDGDVGAPRSSRLTCVQCGFGDFFL